MDRVLIGNAVFFIGALIMIATGFIRNKNRILGVQCVQFAVMGIGQAILGGFTGAITNLVSILRNLFGIRTKFGLPFKLVFCAVQIGMTFFVAPKTLIDWFPTMSACLYTWFLDIKSAIIFKVIMILCQVLWVVYDFIIQNYVGMVFDVSTMVSLGAGIVMLQKAKEK